MVGVALPALFWYVVEVLGMGYGAQNIDTPSAPPLGTTASLGALGGLNSGTVGPMVWAGRHWRDLVDASLPFDLLCWGTFLLFLTTYYVHGLFFLFVDLTDTPSFLVRRRVPRTGRWQQELRARLPRLFANLLINQFVVFIPMAWATAKISRIRVEGTLPPWKEVASEVLLFVLVEEVLFFLSHSLLHHPVLYRWIHKQHHEFKSPTALAAVYAHPVEILVSNLLPLWVWPNLVLNSHLFTWYAWIVAAVVGTQYHHAGYRLLPSWLDHNPDFHDQHHSHFEGNYGLLYLLDWACQSRCEDIRPRGKAGAAAVD